MRFSVAGFIIIFLTGVFISFACKKQITGTESDLYGTWVKGSNLGDTLWFMKKNGKNIVRIPESFNPLMPMYSEKEYKLENGSLSIKIFAPASQDYSSINSFTWIDTGKEFSFQSVELFLFMSSIVTLKYKKI